MKRPARARSATSASTTSCSLTGLTGSPSTDVQKLMCLAKQQVGLSFANTRVKVLSGSADFTSSGTFQKGEAIIVCVEYPVDAMAKFVTPVLGSAVLKTKTSMRIETSYTIGADRRTGDRALRRQLVVVHRARERRRDPRRRARRRARRHRGDVRAVARGDARR